MEFPYCCNLRRSALETYGAVIKIFKCHSQDVRGQSLRQFAAMLRVKAESMFCQLRLNIFSRTAKLGVNRCFHDHSAGILIRRLGNLKVHIAVHAVNARFLQKCHSNMEHLEFVPGSGWVERTGIGLGPGVNGVDRNLGGDHDGDRDMFLGVPVIGKVWLKRRTFADICRLHLTDIETPTR